MDDLKIDPSSKHVPKCCRWAAELHSYSTRAFWCLIPTAFCGPVLVIIAIAFCVDVAHNTRGAEVTLYNTAVAEWEKAPSPATTLAETHGYEFVGDEAGKHSITPAFSSAPNVPTLTADDLDHYNTRAKWAGAGELFPAANWPGNKELFSSFSLLLNSSGVSKNIYTADAIRIAFQQSKQFTCAGPSSGVHHQGTVSHNCPDQCDDAGGVWTAKGFTCTLYWVPDTVCVVVDATTPTAPAQSGSAGCAFDPVRQTFNLVSYRTTTAGTAINYKPVKVQVRSSADPWVRAGDITNGSFDFGVGPEQQVAAAITFFILGFLFLLGPCITVYCLVKRQRRRTGGPRNGGNTRFGDRRRLSDSSDGNGYGASGRSGSVVEVGNYSPVTVPRKAGNGAGQPSAIVI